MEYSIDELIIFSIIVSFLGFCLENIWLCMRKGYIDNRNMTFPFLIGYSFAMIGIYYLLGVPDAPSALVRFITARFDYFSYYVTVFILVSIGEIILGKTVERLCGIYYWDYTGLPLHITRYTSVLTSIGFSFIITKFMKCCFLTLMSVIAKLPRLLFSFGRMIYILMVCDFLNSFYKMYQTRQFNERWRKQICVTHKKLQKTNAL